MKLIVRILLCVVLCGPSVARAAKKDKNRDEKDTSAQVVPVHKVDPAVIAEHITDIVKDVIVLAKRSEDDERKVGPIIVRLFNSILQIILAATNRGLPLDAEQEELHEFLDTLDEETAQEIRRTIILRTKRFMICEQE
jgi:hypothetical protein